MKKLLIVLEDASFRIEWLQDLFEKSDFEIWATLRIDDFLAQVQKASSEKRLGAVVFDHDLSFLATVGGTDRNGNTAAKQIQCSLNTPMLVWSANPVGALDIEKTLKMRGFSQVSRLPFTSENLPRIAAWVLQALNREAS